MSVSLSTINPRIFTRLNLPEEGSSDILLVQFPDGFPNSRLAFNFAVFNESAGGLEGVPRSITGLQKVVQKFLYCLFTTKGTDAFNPSRGTELLELMRGSNLHSQGYVESVIQEAVIDATGQVIALTADELDDSSKLSSVDILNIQIGVNSVAIALSVQSAAGVDAPIFIPFPKLDLNINA